MQPIRLELTKSDHSFPSHPDVLTEETRSFSPFSIMGDSPGDRFLSQITQNRVDENFWIEPLLERAFLSKEIVQQLQSFLTKPLLFRIVITQKTKENLKAVLDKSKKKEKNLKHFFQKICFQKKGDVVFEKPFRLCDLFKHLLNGDRRARICVCGGLARQILADWLLQEGESLGPMQEELKEKILPDLKQTSFDYDFRVWLPHLSYQDLLDLNFNLIDYFAGLIRDNEAPLEYWHLLVREGFIKNVDNPLFKGEDIFISTSFWCGDHEKVDLVFAQKLKRSHLFVMDALEIPVEELLFSEEASIHPISDFDIWQAIIDRLGYILHVDHPEIVNAKGWPREMSLLARKYRCPDEGVSAILLDTFLQSCEKENILHEISKKLTHCHQSHDNGDQKAFAAMGFNALYFLYKQGKISDDEVFTCWKELKIESFADRGAIAIVAEILQNRLLPFSVVAALLEVVGLIAAQTGSVYLTKHDGAPALQIVDDYALLVACAPFEALCSLESFLETPLLSTRAKEAMQKLILQFLPLQGKKSFQLKLNWEKLGLSLTAMEKKALSLLQKEVGLLLGYPLLVLGHALDPKPEKLVSILEHFPRLRLNQKGTLQLMSELKELLLYTKYESLFCIGPVQ